MRLLSAPGRATPIPMPSSPPGYQPRLHQFASLTAAATLLLICAGGLVTSTESGLAVPDWPLSYGMLMPPMVGGILIEHGHRMIASGVGCLTLILCGWLLKTEPRRFVRRLGLLAVAAVCFQGLLGGLNVLWLQPKAVLLGHACLAQGFFCLVVSIALFTSPEWHEAPSATVVPVASPGVHLLSLACVAVVFLQLVLGAVVRHYNAGTAIPDFPLMLGRVIPPLDDPKVVVHFLHRLGAVAVTTVLFTTAYHITRSLKHEDRITRLARLLAGLVVLQITLGAVTVLSATAVVPTTMHVATGAFILGVCVMLALRVHRYVAKPVRAMAPALASREVTP